MSNMTEELKNYQVDVSDALERFLGNEGLYEQMLKKLPGSLKTHEVLEYMKSGDYETALANAHTIKGVTGNLSITKLYNAYAEIVQDLRDGKNEHAQQTLEGILDFQQSVADCINKYE